MATARISILVATTFLSLLSGLLLPAKTALADAQAVPRDWHTEWPRTDFSRSAIPYSEILSGGPAKDGIPAIDRPEFISIGAETGLAATEPVISVVIDGVARAYPLRILIWHEIVNDRLAGVPIAVTYCPLCDAAIVFDRRLDGRLLDFGTTGKLRYSDLVMYDRQTESWWQQFLGRAIVGTLTGSELTILPSRVEPVARFRDRHPDGKILIPPDPQARAYGENPYAGYDGSRTPFLYQGSLPANIAPMARVVAVGSTAWALSLVKARGEILTGDLRLRWHGGLNSALDTADITHGRDIGYVTVERHRTDTGWRDAAHDVTFAFAFHAFHPDGTLHGSGHTPPEQ